MNIVVGCCDNWGIGLGGNSPWRLRGDMAFFKKLTSASPEGTHNAVIMGRKTYFSIPEKFRPLQNRVNIVLSRNKSLSLPEGVHLCKSLDDALVITNSSGNKIHRVFIIGGASIFEEAFNDQRLEAVYLTKVEASLECDTFLPKVCLKNFKRCHSDEFESGVQEEGDLKYEYQLYKQAHYADTLGYDVTMLAAVSSNKGIGYMGCLPWPHIPSDYKSYLTISQTTKRPDGLAVNIKGRLTYEASSKMELERPRVYNIIISSDPKRVPDLPPEQVVPNLSEALRLCREHPLVDTVHILGGGFVFQTAMADPDCTHIILTEVEGEFQSDAHFPEFRHLFSLHRQGELITENGVTYRLANIYIRKYLNLMSQS